MTSFDSASLGEVNRSIKVDGNRGWFRKVLAFFGPAYLVSVGYMDPGNWATDLKGGSVFGYKLLWVVLASSLMAIVLQSLCVRLGLATGKDLAQACRDYYKRPVSIVLWFLCEIAIISCDLAEVIGSAVALKLLFNIDLLYGVLITGLDVFVLLGLMQLGFRKLEAIIVVLVTTVFACFAIEVWQAQPDWSAVAQGCLTPSRLSGESLAIALGILGATVMPHNLYLHSSIVQTRDTERSDEGIKQAIKFNTWDTIIALSAAFFVNAGILILAAAVFHKTGKLVDDFADAPALLKPVLGGTAATLFSVALLAAGQASTITGTLAGQIVMEGFLRVRLKPWLRRVLTRGIAIIPAVLLIAANGGGNTVDLLIWSQVVLSLQLSFAIFPLMSFTRDKSKMGVHVNPTWLTIAGYLISVTIAVLNTAFLVEKFGPIWLGVAALVMVSFALWVRFGYRQRPQQPTM